MAQRAVVETFVPETERRQARPIDLVHLAKQCLGDENLEFEILRMFDKTLEAYFARLKLATTADEVTLTLHSIKGASTGVGAWTVAETAKALEDEIRAGRPVAAERVDDLGLAVEEVRSFISQMLATQDVW